MPATTEAALKATQQAMDQGAEIILGPLFAQSVSAAGQVARARNFRSSRFRPTPGRLDRGLSLEFPAGNRCRSRRVLCGLDRKALLRRADSGECLWQRGRGGVQAGGGAAQRPGGALERYPPTGPRSQRRSRTSPRRQPAPTHIHGGRRRCRSRRVAGASPPASIPGRPVVRHRALGRSAHSLQSGVRRRLVSGDRSRRLRDFAGRYRGRYRQEPPRPATLAYEPSRSSPPWSRRKVRSDSHRGDLTNPSGFTGIDGVFRFRRDGTNQRGLAMMRVTPKGARSCAVRRIVSAASATELLKRPRLLTPPGRRPPHRARESPAA